MSRQIPWARVSAEGIVIIASILLAFGIDAWWARSSAQAEARVELVRVQGELTADRERIARSVQGRADIAAAAFEITTLIEADGQTPVSVPDALLVRVISVGTFETRTPALDGLLRAGRISLIEDVGVRGAIANWERAVRNASELDLRARRLTDDQLVPALWNRGDVGHILRSEVAGLRTPPNVLERLLAGLRVDSTASTWIAPDVRLSAAMSQRFQTAARASGALNVLLQSTDALLEAISATQGR